MVTNTESDHLYALVSVCFWKNGVLLASRSSGLSRAFNLGFNVLRGEKRVWELEGLFWMLFSICAFRF